MWILLSNILQKGCGPLLCHVGKLNLVSGSTRKKHRNSKLKPGSESAMMMMAGGVRWRKFFTGLYFSQEVWRWRGNWWLSLKGKEDGLKVKKKSSPQPTKWGLGSSVHMKCWKASRRFLTRSFAVVQNSSSICKKWMLVLVGQDRIWKKDRECDYIGDVLFSFIMHYRSWDLNFMVHCFREN